MTQCLHKCFEKNFDEINSKRFSLFLSVYPTSYSMGTGFFPRRRRPDLHVDRSLSFIAELKNAIAMRLPLPLHLLHCNEELILSSNGTKVVSVSSPVLNVPKRYDLLLHCMLRMMPCPVSMLS